MKLTHQVSISERPYIDTVAAVVAVLLHWLVLSRWFDPWSSMDRASRLVIDQTGAGVVAVVGSLAAVGIAAGGAGERRRAARRLYGAELRRNWRALLLLSVAASVGCVVAMVADGNGEQWGPYLFEFCILWTVLRMGRLVWLLDALMALEDADATVQDRRPTAAVSSEFVKRMDQAS